MLRQAYYGKPWSVDRTPQWSDVLPVGPNPGNPTARIGSGAGQSVRCAQGQPGGRGHRRRPHLRRAPSVLPPDLRRGVDAGDPRPERHRADRQHAQYRVRDVGRRHRGRGRPSRAQHRARSARDERRGLLPRGGVRPGSRGRSGRLRDGRGRRRGARARVDAAGAGHDGAGNARLARALRVLPGQRAARRCARYEVPRLRDGHRRCRLRQPHHEPRRGRGGDRASRRRLRRHVLLGQVHGRRRAPLRLPPTWPGTARA